MKIKTSPAILSALLLTPVLLLACLFVPQKAEALRDITFPVIGPARFVNDYYVPRPDGIHAATDVMASKGQPLVSAVDGVITYVAYPQPSWGYDVEITDSDGYTYVYLHINDDTPGTNDGNGGPMNAYAPDMKVGNRVVGGQLIGWVGDSGNSNGVPHLHFEIIAPDNSHVNPYEHLAKAYHLPWPNIAPQMPNELLPYGTTFKGGVNIAMGKFDADTAPELISGAGAIGGPHVKLYDHNNALLKQFFAYDKSFSGGVDVAAGDVDGDGTDEIITAAGPTGGPHIRVFKKDGTPIGGGFFAYKTDFRGGVRIAAGDVDGDGKAEIITAPASKGGPHVKVFKSDGTYVKGFFAYSTAFSGGVDVASADVSGDGDAEVITAPGPGGGPHVRIFDADGVSSNSFFAYESSFTGGVKLSAGNVRTGTSKAEILSVPWSAGGPHIRMFNGTGGVINSKMFMEPWWFGYNDVAAGEDSSKAGTGTNRRATIRSGIN